MIQTWVLKCDSVFDIDKNKRSQKKKIKVVEV